MGGKYGFSFSWKRACGISGTKGKISRGIGIPLTRSGRQRKMGRATGCCVPLVFILGSLFILLTSCRPLPHNNRENRSVKEILNYIPQYGLVDQPITKWGDVNQISKTKYYCRCSIVIPMSLTTGKISKQTTSNGKLSRKPQTVNFQEQETMTLSCVFIIEKIEKEWVVTKSIAQNPISNELIPIFNKEELSEKEMFLLYPEIWEQENALREQQEQEEALKEQREQEEEIQREVQETQRTRIKALREQEERARILRQQLQEQAQREQKELQEKILKQAKQQKQDEQDALKLYQDSVGSFRKSDENTNICKQINLLAKTPSNANTEENIKKNLLKQKEQGVKKIILDNQLASSAAKEIAIDFVTNKDRLQKIVDKNSVKEITQNGTNIVLLNPNGTIISEIPKDESNNEIVDESSRSQERRTHRLDENNNRNLSRIEVLKESAKNKASEIEKRYDENEKRLRDEDKIFNENSKPKNFVEKLERIRQQRDRDIALLWEQEDKLERELQAQLE